MKAIAALLALLLSASPAAARLTQAELAGVTSAPPPDARLDPAFVPQLDGHPGFVAFVDYTCDTLCGTDLELLGAGIDQAHLAPDGFRILVIGIDPKDSLAAAHKMADAQLPPALLPVTHLLVPDQAAVARATRALGFHYAYDKQADQFAHPAVVYVVGPDGALRGTLSPFTMLAGDLRRLLAGPLPDLATQVHLLCYAYDPATGRYSLRIDLILKAAGALTVLLLGGTLLALALRARR